MSYDFLCYRPISANPNSEEALSILQSEENSSQRNDAEAREFKEKIASTFIQFNLRLERFHFDYPEVAKALSVSVEQAEAQWNHIELNPPEGDLAIQITIYWNHVSYEIPYWYKDTKAIAVFQLLQDYLLLMNKTFGFFAFDPQASRAFDPKLEAVSPDPDYSRIMGILPAIAAHASRSAAKPWWKFW